MKRVLTIGLILIIVTGKFATFTYAYSYDPVKADIAVEIIEGGTVAIIPSVNSPMPDKTSLYVKDGEIGRFHITFTTVGIYDYTVKNVPDKRKMDFDDEIYSVRIYVTDEGGQLITTIVASTEEDKYSAHSVIEGYSQFGPERLIFKNKLPTEKATTHNKTNKDKPKNNKNKNEKQGDDGINGDAGTNQEKDGSVRDKNRNPKTEDDTKMELYFLFAMLASAGLLLLSIIDMIDTRNIIKEVKKS